MIVREYHGDLMLADGRRCDDLLRAEGFPGDVRVEQLLELDDLAGTDHYQMDEVGFVALARGLGEALHVPVDRDRIVIGQHSLRVELQDVLGVAPDAQPLEKALVPTAGATARVVGIGRFAPFDVGIEKGDHGGNIPAAENCVELLNQAQVFVLDAHELVG